MLPVSNNLLPSMIKNMQDKSMDKMHLFATVIKNPLGKPYFIKRMFAMTTHSTLLCTF
jgi:hypothetical protein